MAYNLKSILDKEGPLFDTDQRKISYYIEEGEWEVTVNKGKKNEKVFTTFKHDKRHINFIEKTFRELDRALPVKFIESFDHNDADISIYFVDTNDDVEWDNETYGMTYWEDDYIDILWQDADGKKRTFTNDDKMTLVHEIGHALGIDHPDGDGENPDFDTDITVMSYNKGREGWPSWYQDLDLEALHYLWGAVIEGSNKRDRLSGTNGDDEIYGHGDDDRINAKAGDDIIHPGDFGKNKDIITTGSGEDVVVLDEDSYVYITDFKTGSDEIDVTALSNLDTWTKGNSTYIGDDDYIYAILKGKNHDLIYEDGFFF